MAGKPANPRSLAGAIGKIRALRGRKESERIPDTGLDYAVSDLTALEETGAESGLDQHLYRPAMLGSGAESIVTRINNRLVVRHNSAQGVAWARSDFVPVRPPIAQIVQAYDAEVDFTPAPSPDDDVITREILPNFRHTPHYRIVTATDHVPEMIDLFFALWKHGYVVGDLAVEGNVVHCALPGREPVLLLNETGALGRLNAPVPIEEDKVEAALSFVQSLEDEALDLYHAICEEDTALFAAYGLGRFTAVLHADDEPEPEDGWPRIAAAIGRVAGRTCVDFEKWNGIQEPLGFYHLSHAPRPGHAERIHAERLRAEAQTPAPVRS